MKRFRAKLNCDEETPPAPNKNGRAKQTRFKTPDNKSQSFELRLISAPENEKTRKKPEKVAIEILPEEQN